MLSGETTNTNFIVFGLTRLGLEPTIYRTLGEHANNCTTDGESELDMENVRKKTEKKPQVKIKSVGTVR